MQTFRHMIDGVEYEFVCDTRSTRSGFKHVVHMMINGFGFNSASVNYYNRTWEEYRYQAAIIKCIDSALDLIKTCYTNDYKRANNVKRMNAVHRQAIDKMLSQDNNYVRIKKLREEV